MSVKPYPGGAFRSSNIHTIWEFLEDENENTMKKIGQMSRQALEKTHELQKQTEKVLLQQEALSDLNKGVKVISGQNYSKIEQMGNALKRHRQAENGFLRIMAIVAVSFALLALFLFLYAK